MPQADICIQVEYFKPCPTSSTSTKPPTRELINVINSHMPVDHSISQSTGIDL